MINWTKEVYQEDINPEVIKEYEQYIKQGFIRVHNPLDYYKSEDDSCPVWEVIKLTEEELLERIAVAKKKEKEFSQTINNLTLIEF